MRVCPAWREEAFLSGGAAGELPLWEAPASVAQKSASSRAFSQEKCSNLLPKATLFIKCCLDSGSGCDIKFRFPPCVSFYPCSEPGFSDPKGSPSQFLQGPNLWSPGRHLLPPVGMREGDPQFSSPCLSPAACHLGDLRWPRTVAGQSAALGWALPPATLRSWAGSDQLLWLHSSDTEVMSPILCSLSLGFML